MEGGLFTYNHPLISQVIISWQKKIFRHLWRSGLSPKVSFSFVLLFSFQSQSLGWCTITEPTYFCYTVPLIIDSLLITSLHDALQMSCVSTIIILYKTMVIMNVDQKHHPPSSFKKLHPTTYTVPSKLTSSTQHAV